MVGSKAQAAVSSTSAPSPNWASKTAAPAYKYLPDQVAFTVTAINSQDEDAESGKIVVELPAETTGLTTIPASTGSFDSSANPPTWTWDIHNLDLVSPDRRSSQGRPPDAITLIVNGVNEGGKRHRQNRL